jgi:hypothetical protein
MTPGQAVNNLISISSRALVRNTPRLGTVALNVEQHLLTELEQLLSVRNGFYSFESALHVFPSESSATGLGLIEWNSANLWRSEYEDLAEGPLFFAEDVFGCQFCLLQNEVRSFDPETGEQVVLASTIEDWAKAILTDAAALTGYPLAHAWQQQNGPLMPGRRLVPKRAFVLGGEFSISNLVAIDAVSGMRSRGNLARQIRDLPDGAQVKYEIVE